MILKFETPSHLFKESLVIITDHRDIVIQGQNKTPYIFLTIMKRMDAMRIPRYKNQIFDLLCFGIYFDSITSQNIPWEYPISDQ